MSQPDWSPSEPEDWQKAAEDLAAVEKDLLRKTLQEDRDRRRGACFLRAVAALRKCARSPREGLAWRLSIRIRFLALAMTEAEAPTPDYDPESVIERETARILREAAKGATRDWLVQQIKNLMDLDHSPLGLNRSALHLLTRLPDNIAQAWYEDFPRTCLLRDALFCEIAIRELRNCAVSLLELLKESGFEEGGWAVDHLPPEVTVSFWESIVESRACLYEASDRFHVDCGELLNMLASARAAPVEVDGESYGSYHGAVFHRALQWISIAGPNNPENMDFALDEIIGTVSAEQIWTPFSHLQTGLDQERRMVLDGPSFQVHTLRDVRSKLEACAKSMHKKVGAEVLPESMRTVLRDLIGTLHGANACRDLVAVIRKVQPRPAKTEHLDALMTAVESWLRHAESGERASSEQSTLTAPPNQDRLSKNPSSNQGAQVSPGKVDVPAREPVDSANGGPSPTRKQRRKRRSSEEVKSLMEESARLIDMATENDTLVVVQKLADSMNVSRSSLYKDERVLAALTRNRNAIAKKGRRMPRGYKSSDGSFEAY